MLLRLALATVDNGVPKKLAAPLSIDPEFLESFTHNFNNYYKKQISQCGIVVFSWCWWLGDLCDARIAALPLLEVTCNSLGPAGTRIIVADATAMYVR